MLTIQITGLEDLRRNIQDLSERRIKAAVATAMTRTAVKARDALKAELMRSIDKPTPYTVRAIKYSAASANRLVAAVGFDVAAIQDVYGNVVRYADLGPGQTPAGKYMQWTTNGGARTQKRFEKALQAVGALPSGWRAVPGSRAKVNAYGNQNVGEIRQILSWFDAAELVAGSRQNMGPAGRARRRKGTKKTAGFEYVYIPPGTKGLRQPGIYRRTKFALGSRVEPVVIFVKQANYRKQFDFYGVTQREIDRNLAPEFNKAIAASIARMGAK